jgi:hypothetical protein
MTCLACRRLAPLALVASLAAALLAATGCGADVWAGTLWAADDGRRAVDVKRFGVSVRVPQAWRLISWARDNEAFMLRIPQDAAASKGYVQCELGIAPEHLADLLHHERPVLSTPEKPQKARLLESRVEPIDPARMGTRLAQQVHERLLSSWELENAAGDRSFEVSCRLAYRGTLYTFIMLTDEAHYEAYRLDFEDMLASAQFSSPETGLERMPGGLWLQRNFHFALRLPEGWKPAFGPNDKSLFFATGPGREGLTDSVVVEATPPRPLDLEQLKTTLPAELTQRDPRARVTCEVVPQAGTFALQMRISTWRGQTPVSVLERRFRTSKRNYIIRFTCEAGRLEQLEPQFRKTLASFVEVLDTPKRDEA